MADAAKKEVAPSYLIENVVRKQGTRLHRARATTRHRFKQYVAGMRVIRGKKLPLTEEAFRKEEAKIVAMLQEGLIAVHTPDHIRITTLPDGRYVLTKMGTGATKVLEKGETPSCFGRLDKTVKGPERTPQPPPTPVKEVKQDVTEKTEPDDLTQLPNIGGGRARKLVSRGITSFAQIASMGASALAEMLSIDEEVASDIIGAAKGR